MGVAGKISKKKIIITNEVISLQELFWRIRTKHPPGQTQDLLKDF